MKSLRRAPAALVLPFLGLLGCLPAPLLVERAAEPPPAAVAQAASCRPEDVPSPEKPAPLREGGPPTWGIAGLRAFAFDQQVAPNGLEYKPLFVLDLNFNLWLSQSERVYLFADSAFWGQRAAPGITNSHQGPIDFSKRELDLSLGAAWNYYGRLEARAFVYSFNNLNRGTSPSAPTGYADGVGLENRYYLGENYDSLGTSDYDVARASFVSLGYYPTKDLTDASGNRFKPGPFARAYLTLDLGSPRYYLYADAQFIASRRFDGECLRGDFGVALRPFESAPRLEFRVGSNLFGDPQSSEWETGFYGQIRFLY
jgi:hypothetical protein